MGRVCWLLLDGALYDAGDQLVEPLLVPCEQGSGGFLEAGLVTGHGGHEPVACFPRLPHAILLDAHASDSYGGTGQTLDWNMIRDERDRLLGLPLILAGGLTPDNVAEAIATARPDAVDVASGVESSPGKKDPAKVRDFVAAAKEAFAHLGATKTKES